MGPGNRAGASTGAPAEGPPAPRPGALVYVADLHSDETP